MSTTGGSGMAYDAAEHRRQFELELQRREERLARWIVPGPDGDPAGATLPDGRPVWQIVAAIWARDRDLRRAAADGLADPEALDTVLEYFQWRGGSGMIEVLSRSVPPEALPAPPALPDSRSMPPALRAALAACRVDLLREKHEGPWNLYWPYKTRDAAEGEDDDRLRFRSLAGHVVLLPAETENPDDLTVLRAVVSADGATLLLELRDARAERIYGRSFGGVLAVCDRWPGHRFFVCHTYHEWYPVGPGAGAWGSAGPDEAD